MACRYEYNDQWYTKEELVELMAKGEVANLLTNNKLDNIYPRENQETLDTGIENIFYSHSTVKGDVNQELAESNAIFEAQLNKLKVATNNTLIEGKPVPKNVLEDILDDIRSKGTRTDYDHIGIDHTDGTIRFYNSKTPQANERAKKAIQLAEDLTMRTGLPYKIDYYSPTPGRFERGSVVINPYHPKFDSDVVWHEAIGHPIVEAIFQQAENSALITSLKEQIDANVGGIQEFMAEEYPEYEPKSENYYKEGITTLLGRYLDFQNKKVNEFKVKEQISLQSAIVRFLERFLARVKNVLNDIITNYNSSKRKISIEDLKNNSFTIQELATLLGSTQNYFDLSDVKFNQKFWSKTSTISPLEADLVNAQTQGVRQSLEDQLFEARKQATKQLRILKNKVTPEQRKTLIRLLNYLEDPQTFGHVRTFSTYMSETEALLKYYLNDGIKTARELGNSADKISKLRFVLQVAESYEPIITAMEREYTLVDNDNEFKKIIRSSQGTINDIKALFAREVELPIASILAETAAPAVKDVVAQIDSEISYLNGRLKTATGSREKNIQERINRLETQKDSLTPTQENILAAIRGQRGDVNILSMYLEAPISSGDMVIGTFAKYIKDMLNSVRARLLPLKNQAQEQIDSYASATGRSNLNNRTFYEGLYEPVKRLTINEETGDYKEEEYYALVGQHNQAYIVEQQKFYADMKRLKKEGKLADYRAKLREFEEWKNENMEREYTEVYYAAEKLLHPEARELQQALLDQISILRDSIKSTGGSVEDSEELDLLWRDYTDLGRTYDRMGNKKTGKDLEIAESIQAFRKARREMETYELTEEGQANFNAIKQRQLDKVSTGHLTQEQYDKWLRKNITRRINPEFYDERRKITERISAILGKLPPEVIGKESTDNLWEAIFAITGNHRDEDRVPMGSDLNSDELSRVRTNETKLEDIKQRAISLGGLSPKEAQELNALFNIEPTERSEDIENRISELLNKKAEKQEEISKYINDAEYKLLMSSFDELSKIQEANTTEYYDQAYQVQFDAFVAELPNSESMSNDMLRSRFESENKWFKDNHVYKLKPKFDVGGNFKGYQEVAEPLYIWRDVIPTNASWIDYNYPSFKYLDRIVNPQYINPNYRNSVDGYNVPKPGKYVNETYTKLGTAQKQMLQFLTNTYEEAQKRLPMEKRMGLMLPAIEKDNVDRLQDSGGIKSTFRQQLKGLKRKWTLTEQDSDTALGDVAGIEFNYIPVKFTGKISTDDVNLNLMESILKHRYMAEEYQVLEESQSVAYALQYTLADDAHKISTGKIDAVLKKIGINTEVLKRGESNRSRQLQEFIKTVWYGELQKDSHLWNFSINKITNNLMGISAMQMLALNIPAHITNLISGEVQSFIEANANKYFSRTDWLDAKRVYARNIGNFWQDYRKEGKKSLMGQITDLYGVPQGEFENEFGEKTDYSNLREGRGWLFFTKNAGEHEIQVSTFIAMASRKMVKKGDSMVRLIDAYELDESGNLRLKEGVEFTEGDLNNFIGKVHSLLKDLNGNYNKFDRPLIEKYSIGRLLTFMRKFLVPMVTRRFETTRLDLEMGEIQQGYYITFANTFLRDVLKYKGNVYQAWGDLTETQKQAVKRTAAELGIILTFAILISLLGGYDDDRDLSAGSITEGQFWKMHLLYQAMKVKSETENFLPFPGLGFDEAIRTTKTTSIAWRSLEQVSGVAQEMAYIAVNSDKAYYQKDYGIWSKGDLKLVGRLGKLVGFTGNVAHPELLIRNFELGQKVK